MIGAKEKGVTFGWWTSPPHAWALQLNFYMWTKVVCLFCLSHWDPPNHGASHHALGMIGKPSISTGALRWFVNVKNYNARIINYWVFFKEIQ